MMIPPNAPGNGLPGSLRALGMTFLALACARAELISVELQEEKARARQRLILGTIAALFLAIGLLLAALLVVVLFWDSHRTLAASGVALLYIGIGGWALFRLQQIASNSPPPFSATMNEFANDLRLLRGHHE
jgi:uncharacterized membrane protein YqjE